MARDSNPYDRSVGEENAYGYWQQVALDRAGGRGGLPGRSRIETTSSMNGNRTTPVLPTKHQSHASTRRGRGSILIWAQMHDTPTGYPNQQILGRDHLHLDPPNWNDSKHVHAKANQPASDYISNLGFRAIAAHSRTSLLPAARIELLPNKPNSTSHPAYVQRLLGGMSSPSATHMTNVPVAHATQNRLYDTAVGRMHHFRSDDVVPNEIISLILELLPDQPLDYQEVVVTRGNILQLSKRFNELCLSTPELWATIDVHFRKLGPWDSPGTMLSLEKLDVQLPRSHSLKCMFPVLLLATATIPIDAPIVPPDAPLVLPYLTSLGIDCQSSEIWAKVLASCDALERLVLASCDALERLVYGSTNALGNLIPIPRAICTLRYLRIYRMSCMPPVSAPNLEELSVMDPNVGFTAAAFSQLVASTAGKVALRTLDLLVNPVRNEDLDIILDRCSDLRVLRLCSNSQCDLRTSTYITLRYKFHTTYLRLGRKQFVKAEFSHPPPNNTWASSARREFEALSRLGVVRNDREITIYPSVFRVEVLGCSGDFPNDMFSSGIDRFKTQNGFGDSLLAAQPYELIHLISVPTVFTVILPFHDGDEAMRAVRNGVKQGGRTRNAIQFHPVWDDDAGTFV
ncbi:hypothetical protein C8R46DRAFT_1042149 [Mycena filopes]|nr:hypothetical protein C8R46DRAFT_1042149 [Mycena filopes]